MAVNLYMCLIVTSCLIPSIIGGGIMTGSYRPIDTNRADVQEAANFAVRRYNEGSNDVNLCALLKIVEAESQVVAGTNYKLFVEIGRTSCRKNQASDACDVANSDVSQTFDCKFVIYKSLPLPEQEFSLTESNCNPK